MTRAGAVVHEPTLDADPGVVLGCRPGRDVRLPVLRVGARARLRSGTVLYRGTRIGDDFETGHGVVVREQCRIGDEVRIWNHTTIDYDCTVGDRVRIHCNCYVAQGTRIEDNVFLASTIGHVQGIFLNAGYYRSFTIDGNIVLDSGTGYGINPNYSSFLGSEIDLIAGWAVTRFAQLEAGYAHFFHGDYISQSLSAPTHGARDADFVYLQFNLNF